MLTLILSVMVAWPWANRLTSENISFTVKCEVVMFALQIHFEA